MNVSRGVLDLLEHRDLEIHFMPIVRLLSRASGISWRSFAFEALVRGPEMHPLRNPVQLFEAATAAGVRGALELVCVEAALRQQPRLPGTARLFLNVGLSTFMSEDFLDLMQRHHQLTAPGQVVVEVLEDQVPSAESFRAQSAVLRGMGFAIALDDLTADAMTLHRLIESGPVAFWKLDRSVLQQWADRCAWVRKWLPMITHAARQMGTEVVVEGFEGPHMHLLPGLCEAGVTLGQGFVFGKPAILGPGLDRWRQGFCEMIPSRGGNLPPPLIPVQLEQRVRDMLAVASRPPVRQGLEA